MTLGESLKQYVGGERKQSAVAAAWREEMGGKWTQSHVESQLSRCLGDQVAAIRFFFLERVRALAFMKALGVPASTHEAIIQLAEDALAKNGERPVRLLLDLVPWSGKLDTKKLFDAVRASIIEPRPLKPCVLLVTREQYDDLPRSFDHEKDWLEARTTDGEDRELYAKLDGHALIASQRPFEAERWAAIGFDPAGLLVFEPSNALAQFADVGALSLPAVEHDLEHFVSTADLPPARVPKDSLERRRWMSALRTEDAATALDPDPRVRLSTARSLGVAALATHRDRIEHELAVALTGLPTVTAKPATKEQLEKLLSSASRFPVAETLLRVGDELHVINPASMPEATSPRIVVHRIEAKPTALRRLQTFVDQWDEAERDADSFLWGAIERLGEGADDHLALLHARTTLARTAKSVPEVPEERLSSADAIDALTRIVGGEPPAARLRLRNRGHVIRSSLPDWATRAVTSCDELDANFLLFTHSLLSSVVVDRSSPLGLLYDHRDRHGYGPTTHFVVDKETPDERAWVATFENFVAKKSYPSGMPPIEVKPYAVPQSVWAEADHHLALVWLFLRRLRERPVVQRADGVAIVHVSTGLGIELEGFRTKRTFLSTTAIIDTHERESYGNVDVPSSTQYLEVGIVGQNSITARVPRPVTLLSGNVRLKVNLIASPLLGMAALGAIDDRSSDDYVDD